MTITDNLENEVRNIFAKKLGIDSKGFGLNSNIFDELGADFLDEAELVLAIENEYGISISDSDREQLRTVGQYVEYVKRHKGSD